MSMDNTTEKKPSIDDILDSIKETIQKRDNSDEETTELELTEVVSNNEDDAPKESTEGEQASVEDHSIVSKATAEHTKALLKDFAETAETLGRKININNEVLEKKDKTLEKFVIELLEPQMKEWLNTHLPNIVREVVSEEVKKLVANMHNK